MKIEYNNLYAHFYFFTLVAAASSVPAPDVDPASCIINMFLTNKVIIVSNPCRKQDSSMKFYQNPTAF